jgi:hypothetical protein
VTVDGHGGPTAIRVRDRLDVRGRGELVVRVPAPALAVEPLDDHSSPGLRYGTVIWQGYVDGLRRLGALVTVDPAAGAAGLPVTVTVDARVDGRPLDATPRDGALDATVTVTGTTAVTGRRLLGDPVRADVARVVDGLAAARPGVPRRDSPVRLGGAVRTAPIDGGTPLAVTGTVAFAPGTVTLAAVPGATIDGATAAFAATLAGDGRPVLRWHLQGRAHGAVAPRLALQVVPVGPVVAAPGARPARALLDEANGVLLALGVADRYTTYLANPDQRGAAVVVYSFATAPPATAATRAGPGDGPPGVVVALVAVGALVLAGGGLVWWAHS